MSGSISFNGIGSPRVPGTYVEFDNTRAVRGLTEWPAKVVLLGQRLPAGTVAEATPTRITHAGQAITAFGRGSNLAHMFEAWFRVNPPTEVWGVALADAAGGAAATRTLTASGTATAGGVIALLVAGRRVEVAVTAGQASTAVAAAVNAAINATLDLPVTSTVTTSVVTATARHRGLIGNGIDIRHSPLATDALPAGLGLAIASGVAGTLTPTAATALDALGEVWFTDIVMPWTDATSVAALEARLAANFGPLLMRDTHGWISLGDTFGNLITYGAARNSPNITTLPFRGSPTPAWEWAATMAAMCVPALAIDPARPVQTLQLPGLTAPAIADRFSYTEREQLLRTGLATWTVNDAGQVFVERAVTNYLTAPSGAADVSYLDVETLKTLAYLRYDLRTWSRLRFPRHKLADDGTNFARGQNVVTPGTYRAELIARAMAWEAAGLIEDIAQFKRDLIVVRNVNDPNRLDVLLPPNLVNQFRIAAFQIEFLL